MKCVGPRRALESSRGLISKKQFILRYRSTLQQYDSALVTYPPAARRLIYCRYAGPHLLVAVLHRRQPWSKTIMYVIKNPYQRSRTEGSRRNVWMQAAQFVFPYFLPLVTPEASWNRTFAREIPKKNSPELFFFGFDAPRPFKLHREPVLYARMKKV
jgi:hypothetical protein